MIRFHLLFKYPHLGFNIVDLFECRQCGSVNGFARIEIDVLSEQPKLKAIYRCHFPRVRRFSPGHEPENRGLAGAVSPDKPDLFARIYLERKAAKHIDTAIGFSYIGKPEKHKTEETTGDG